MTTQSTLGSDVATVQLTVELPASVAMQLELLAQTKNANLNDLLLDGIDSVFTNHGLATRIPR